MQFSAVIGGRITESDIDNPDSEKHMTLYYSASTPSFTFGSDWSYLGVPSMSAANFPSSGVMDLYLGETELSEGLCISSIKEQLDGFSIDSTALLSAAETIEKQIKVTGSDLCGRVDSLMIEENKASMQLFITIDMFDETKVDFTEWGNQFFTVTPQVFASARNTVFGMDTVRML